LPNDFVFVLVEKTPPFGLAVFRLAPEAVELARSEVERGVAIYQKCERSGVWLCYSETVQTVDLPAWAYKATEVSQ